MSTGRQLLVFINCWELCNMCKLFISNICFLNYAVVKRLIKNWHFSAYFNLVEHHYIYSSYDCSFALGLCLNEKIIVLYYLGKDKKPEKKSAIKEIPPRESAPKEFPQRKEVSRSQEPSSLPATVRSDQMFNNKQNSNILPQHSEGRIHEAATSSSRMDDLPSKNTYKPPDRAPSGPDPARISIRNSLRETLLARYFCCYYVFCRISSCALSTSHSLFL